MKISISKAEIEWWDSYANQGTWHDAKELIETKNTVSIHTIGWIYKKEKDRIHIAMSLHFEGKDITRLGGTFVIPKGCIKKIKYL